ncbi:hypothetical protein [Streptomyces boncukensis]|uniref:Secreted protein n=1 Tax=Streptomyces boncukensis TaxID=2711219 RepID=A0A6G4X1H1_9ACTN|nr:hypothetical protein [Streptomyces boncukensis]NGO70511.1 hypothetical protein [Streptomyces boncukensis]
MKKAFAAAATVAMTGSALLAGSGVAAADNGSDEGIEKGRTCMAILDTPIPLLTPETDLLVALCQEPEDSDNGDGDGDDNGNGGDDGTGNGDNGNGNGNGGEPTPEPAALLYR